MKQSDQKIPVKDKLNALDLAYSIVTDKRNANRYSFSALTDTKTMERFEYSDMLRVLEAMYDEIREAPAMQKPLTLEELHALIDPGDEVVTYCEAKGAERTYANIWTGDLVIDIVGFTKKNHVCFENYGKTWRAWATRPTDEERAAAPWEE